MLLHILCLSILCIITSCDYTRAIPDCYTEVYPEPETCDYGNHELDYPLTFTLSQLLEDILTDNRYTCEKGKPLFIFSEIDNSTNLDFPPEEIHEIIKTIAFRDGRFIIEGKFYKDEKELGSVINKIIESLKCSNFYRDPTYYRATPQFEAKLLIEMPLYSDCNPPDNTYSLTITLYDPQTKEPLFSKSNCFWRN